MLQIKTTVPVLLCELTGLLHMDSTASDSLLIDSRMMAISTAKMTEARCHMRLWYKDSGS